MLKPDVNRIAYRYGVLREIYVKESKRRAQDSFTLTHLHHPAKTLTSPPPTLHG